jgi:hypothetical protein
MANKKGNAAEVQVKKNQQQPIYDNTNGKCKKRKKGTCIGKMQIAKNSQ